MKRVLIVVAVATVLLVGLGAVGVWSTVRASLPDLEGEVAVAGLGAPVAVERDAAGVLTIRAGSRADAARALGFVHAQERWFQMDLLRRAPAGELSALLGAATWRADSTHRLHRFRARARAVVAALPADQRAVLDAYVGGVNAGLDALGARPFEYLALRQAPEPWRPEDSILAAFAMVLDLQFDGGHGIELDRTAVEAALPGPLAAFLMPEGDEWDAPIEGDAMEPPPVPTAAQLDGVRPGAETRAVPDPPVPGSNNWAVAGDLSATGSALVADDMHLGLRLPHIWFRASLVVGDRRVTGVTLPGTPLVVVGSNGDVAWGFTNSYADYIDYVRLVEDPDRQGWVRTDSGSVAIDTLRERVAVGDEVREVVVLETPWGPITHRDADGAAYAMQWGAHRPEATNLALLDVERATTLDQALDAANRAGIPGQNFVAGDRAGRIGWTIAGQLPHRVGRDGKRPVDSTDPDARWSRFLRPDEVPRVVDPEDGRLWTANARVVSGEALAVLGGDNYAHGARARQIRDALRALDAPISERDLLAIQLDDRALFYARWRDLLLNTLDGAPDTEAARALGPPVRDWSGHADDLGYRLVRDFRSAVVERVLPPLMAPVVAREPRAELPGRDETVVWQLVAERPPHLLPAGHASWDALLLDAADAVARDDVSTPWAVTNTLRMEHPMASVLPGLGDKLVMPMRPQAGDQRMPRVSGRSSGASQRMVVSPGHEERGIFHMPGGQAGHPLSPYWGAGHDDWAEGRPSPFLPGETRWTLALVPPG
ncbi:penicillin acylase family protein [Rubrivirga sp.]|uniref:penicillin acylase family protein n=1 Tax=Rubrivirga sp. TaxID=1885344 RepID=UPI003B517C85